MARHVLTIAGSDSGAGAGIQADLKTFSALGVYGSTVVTAVTAQNTCGVQDWLALPPSLVAEQIRSVRSDIGAVAVKTGMLANAEIIDVVAAQMKAEPPQALVVDPVMAAKGGDPLVDDTAVAGYRESLFPLATIVTPNLPEVERILGRQVQAESEMRRAAQAIVEFGCRAALIKGGHAAGSARDILFDGSEFYTYEQERIATNNDHGTGCTLASAIAAYLALGLKLPDAVREAKEYLTGALRHAYAIGAGHSPVNHFWRGINSNTERSS
ncbi:MAG: bifunctional hydroxymethylpyrimidine kinase/phosphomethylpyrimidine kinase [Chloroflexi bacterium]|nr:bifunctional hydroxymethylpyrimidine kinase/phosphomethylpyrimidine kinase [Chloroflexota bacterium]